MSNQQILKAIADKIGDDRLHFQIIVQKQNLYVYINRDTEEYVDYKELTANIHLAISTLDGLDLLRMGL